MSAPIDGFEHFRAAWYGDHPLDDDLFDEVKFGPYASDGPAPGHLSIRWYRSGTTFGSPRLEVNSPDWPLLNRYAGVLQELATLSNRDVTPNVVIEVLREHQFEDLTEVTVTPLFSAEAVGN